jgi:hypothetical protein
MSVNGFIDEYSELTSLNFTTSNIIKVAGIGGASNDITAKYGYIEYKPAGLN